MKIEIYQICKESLVLEGNYINNKDLIYLIEAKKLNVILLKEYLGVDLNIFMNKFVHKMTLLFSDLLNYEHIKGFLVPAYIKNGDNVCDGFAYISKIPVVAISNFTDVFSVLCHELCHLIVHSIEGTSSIACEHAEIFVELVEYIICKDILPDCFLPTKEDVKVLRDQYEKSDVSLKEFLISHI